ncbi:methyltransferase domain-containing protein [Saccharomonospora sp. NPDC046836]|uniref:methyltransferase domain-containing protein n=1 Tax=Saccharomonospora sp. NPDC046836 TaxID=3156921 RepID=UPI0033E8273A
MVQEIQEKGLGQVVHIGHREVWFRCAEPGPALLGLRCADDVFVIGAVVTGVGRERASLHRLARAAMDVPLRSLLSVRQRCGATGTVSAVEVSASFLGRRNYNRYDIEDAVGEPLAAALGVPYHSRRGDAAPLPGGLGWRVTVESGRAVLALRLGECPLHRRTYRRLTRPGSLHPPLAAALVRLARPAVGATLLDPCCGSGTVPIEAALSSPAVSVVGCDRDPHAIQVAVINGEVAPVRWTVADAGELPLRSAGVDVIVSNPPWGRQVRPQGTLANGALPLWRELHRVLRPGGRAVLLLPAAEVAQALAAGLALRDRRPVSIAGTHAEVITLQRS